MTAPAQPIEQHTGARVALWRPPFLRSLPLRLSVLVICFLWTLPTLGLLVTSFRDPAADHDSPAGGRRCSTRSKPTSGRCRTTRRSSRATAWATRSSTA